MDGRRPSSALSTAEGGQGVDRCARSARDPFARAGPGRQTECAFVAFHTNPSGSVNEPLSLLMEIRCDPVPSAGTPTSLAAARRVYNASLIDEFPAANSTYLLPKLFAAVIPCSR